MEQMSKGIKKLKSQGKVTAKAKEDPIVVGNKKGNDIKIGVGTQSTN